MQARGTGACDSAETGLGTAFLGVSASEPSEPSALDTSQRLGR